MATISSLPNELFDIVVESLNAREAQSSMFALALSCRGMCGVIIPRLLYRTMVLEGRACAEVLARIFDETLVVAPGGTVSRHIRHLCLLDSATPPDESMYQHQPSTAVALRELFILISHDHLPNLESLDLRESGDVWPHESYSMGEQFWVAMARSCPKLASLRLSGSIPFWGFTPGPFALKALRTFRVRLEGYQFPNPDLGILYPEHRYAILDGDADSFPPNIETLEVGDHAYEVSNGVSPTACEPDGIMTRVFPKLRCLILPHYDDINVEVYTAFWKAHPGLERLELLHYARHSVFRMLTPGVLPNLHILQCSADSAYDIPTAIWNQLTSLTMLNTTMGQAPYILRTKPLLGVLPGLQYLGIELLQSTSSESEGSLWREVARTTEDPVETPRFFDADYIQSISRAAPNIRQLSLDGISEGAESTDLLVSFARFQHLRYLLVSGPTLVFSEYVDRHSTPFFPHPHLENEWRWDDDGEGRKTVTSFSCRVEEGPYKWSALKETCRSLGQTVPTLDTIRVSKSCTEDYDPGAYGACIRRDADGMVLDIIRVQMACANVYGRDSY